MISLLIKSYKILIMQKLNHAKHSNNCSFEVEIQIFQNESESTKELAFYLNSNELTLLRNN